MQLAVLRYEDFFTDYSEVNPSDLIKGISSKYMLERISLSIMKLLRDGLKNQVQFELFYIWTKHQPHSFHAKLEYVIDHVDLKKRIISFIDNNTSLIFLDLVLKNFNDIKYEASITQDQELKLFKAYMYCLKKLTDKQQYAINNVSKKEDPLGFVLSSQFYLKESLYVKDSGLSILKAIYFFQYCEKDLLFNDYLRLFLKKVKADSWRDYIRNIMAFHGFNLLNTILQNNVFLKIDDEYTEINSFLNEMTINLDDYKSREDFLEIRERPIIELESGEYMILNMSFFLDKLYQSIQFTFAKTLVNNKSTYKGKIIDNNSTFFGIYGDVAEEFIFYRVMEDCFGNSSSIKFTGNYLKKFIDGSPDYYIRNHNNVFVFEFKNVYLNSKFKLSTDLETIKKAILSKLSYEDEKVYIGVPQLVRVVKKIINGEFEKVDICNLNKIKIYPILVYVDQSFDAPGVNFFLNDEFRKRISLNDTNNKFDIKNLTCININTFIEFQDLFKKRIASLNQIIDKYYDSERKVKDIYGKYFSLSDHLPHSQYGKKVNFANVVRKLIKVELDNK